MKAWQDNFQGYDHYLGVMFAGKTSDGTEDIVYVAMNTYWEDLTVELPSLPNEFQWKVALDSSDKPMKEGTIVSGSFVFEARSVVALVCVG